MKNRKVVILIIFAFAIGLISGLLLQRQFSHKAPRVSMVHEKGFKYTSPLLYEEMPQDYTPFLREINRSLTTYIDKASKEGLEENVSVYVRFPSLPDWTVINGEEKYSPASLLKVPLMMWYLNRAEYKPSRLSQSLKYDTDLTSQRVNYKPNDKMEKGKSYTVMNLIKRMIIYSDNTAEDILAAQLKENDFNQIFDAIRIDRLDYLHQEDSMNVKTYSYFFRVLYDSTFLSRRISERALKLLTQTTFSKGIDAGVPKRTTVAHKFGERSFSNNNVKQLHDCGIVYFPKNPYILCVMTRGNSFKNLEKVIRNISEITYKSALEQSQKSKSDN